MRNTAPTAAPSHSERVGIVAAVRKRNAATYKAKLSASVSAYPPTLTSGPPIAVTSPVSEVETTNRTPRVTSSSRPRSRNRRKSGRSLNGTAQIRLNAFCAAIVTPSPPHSAVSRPITSAVTFPLSACDCNWSPTTGNRPSTEFLTSL